jgi:hypothetical protein
MSTTIADAAELRRSIYDKGAAAPTDLVGLIGLGPQRGDDPGFLALVAEVARDVLVHDADPPGIICDEAADWLTDRLGDGRGLTCRAEFEALTSALTHAVRAPPSLIAFAVREIERAVLTGRRGPLGGAETEPGVVTAEDVAALRLVVFSPAAAGRVDRAAAEALFDIAHATATAANDPGFADLFAAALGQYLADAASAPAPRRDEHEAAGPLGLAEFLKTLGGGLAAALGRKSVDQLAEERYALETAASEARLEALAGIEAGEAKWVLFHLARGGELSAAERRLLATLRDGAPRRIASLLEHAA